MKPGRWTKLLLLLLPAATLLPAVGCNELLTGIEDERYGRLLSPDEVENCPQGCTPYVTAPNDSLPMIAKRAYGRYYKSYLIRVQNAKKLEEITKPDGRLEEGKILFLPPDRGEPLDRHDLEERWHFGGG
jgi:hypothetical protein